MTKQQQYIEPVGFKGTPGELEHFIQPAIKGTCDTINVGSKRVATLEFVGIEEMEANAALIANAKEAIKALQDLVYDFEDTTDSIVKLKSLEHAREVIAKSIPPTKEKLTTMDNLFEQLATLTKAQGYDILADQVKELKEVIRQLIEVGELEDITFTDEAATKLFQYWVNRGKILSL